MQPELCIFSLAYIHNIYTTFNSAQLTKDILHFNQRC